MAQHICEICGREFKNKTGLSNHKTQSHNEPWQDKQKLQDLYVDKSLSQTEIAEKLGTTQANISNKLRQYGIERQEPWKDEQTLRDLYNEKGLTQREIAEKFGVPHTNISYHMRKHGMKTNNDQDLSKPVVHQFQDYSNRRVGYDYEVIRTQVDGKVHTIGVHRLVAYAHGKITSNELFSSSHVVHHINNHGLDNRPSNLKGMTRSEHTKHHKNQ